MTHRFTILVERDPESDWLVGEVVELPGCYTQAPNMSELEKICARLSGFTLRRLRIFSPSRHSSGYSR
jgi:hypothetical protein